MAETICDDKGVVLIVDDEEMIAEMIGDIVERHGCQHVSFNDPQEALQYYKGNSQRITIMVTDLTMPFISGAGLIREVVQINPKLPIILVTGYDDEHIPDDIVPLVHQIVPKPFTKSELLDAVRTEPAKNGHKHLPI
jgi:DNA-binding NtrC family response regulator